MDAIHKAPHDVAHAVLVALCHDNGILRTKALKMIKQYEYNASERTRKAGLPVAGVKRKADASESEVAIEAATADDPKKEELLVCRDCSSIFTPQTQRGPSICRFHSGDLEADETGDFWADHDENCHGLIDSDFCRQEYPQGYRWECCERPNADETLGCRKRNHHVSLQEDDAKKEKERAKRAKRLKTRTALTAPDVPIEISSDEDEEDNENLSDDVSDTLPSGDEGPDSDE